MDWLLAATALIVLHNVDGQPILVNREFITMLHPTTESRGGKNQLVTGGVNCVVSLTNAKFFSVVETCDEVRRLMEGK